MQGLVDERSFEQTRLSLSSPEPSTRCGRARRATSRSFKGKR